MASTGPAAAGYVAGMVAPDGQPADAPGGLAGVLHAGLGAWRSTWIDPRGGRVRRFTGRPEGADIILDGLDDDPAERWCFRDIAPGAVPESFRWTGEVSTDGRRTWRLDEEMLIRRR